MVTRTVQRTLILAIGMTLSLALHSGAQTRVQTDVESLVTLRWTGDELALTGFSRATADFRSPQHPMVQGRLQLRLTVLDVAGTAFALPEVPRAYVRFRFPVTEDYLFRVTAGRDRLSWGVGSLFNAGDLLFGADGRDEADFTRPSDVRDETAWLTAAYFPIGALGYLEAVGLPPLPPVAGMVPAGTPGDPPDTDSPGVSECRAGVRLHLATGPLSVEPAYLYDGRDDAHRVALSFGSAALGADIYATGSLDIPTGADALPELPELLRERSRVSAGVFRSYAVGYDGTLNARLEALVRPGGAWESVGEPTAHYGLLLHPELVYIPGRTVTILSRAVVSPIDGSAQVTAGATWNIFQGFTALAFGVVQIGDDTSVYGWDRDGSVAISAGFRYEY